VPGFGTPTEAVELRLLNILLAHVAVFGVAALVSVACSVTLPTTAFRCSPADPSPNCPSSKGDNYLCCSDDPAALRLSNIDQMVTPKYQGRGGVGVPLFSGGNNPFSRTGMCIREGSVPPLSGLVDINAQGCPIPCNPTWSKADRDTVCGVNTICCQTVEIEPEDCVFDPDVGSSGCWRPATGFDITNVGTKSLTTWGGTSHMTHQDPSGINCDKFVQGLPESVLSAEGLTRQDVLRACYRRLTVANQRGFCLGIGGGVAGCPLAQPSYRDACEQMNDREGRSGCAEVEFP
jgi:hypothetical protein